MSARPKIIDKGQLDFQNLISMTVINYYSLTRDLNTHTHKCIQKNRHFIQPHPRSVSRILVKPVTL